MPTASADPDVTPAAPSKPAAIEVTLEPIAHTLGGEEVTAPCDFHRLYRGTIGKVSLSAYLKKGANAPAISGTIHYDTDRPAVPIERGQTSDGVGFELTEKGGGVFRGTCDRASGALRGTYSRANKSESFTLWPRPQSWPALYARFRKTRVEANHPRCRTQAKANEATEILIGPDESALCLPTNPKKRAEVIAEGVGVCEADDFGVRVWDLAAPITTAVNQAISSVFYDEDAKAVKRCWGTASTLSNTVVLFAADDVMTVGEAHSVYFGGAHPINSESGGTTVDLSTGKAVVIEDIVTRPNELKHLVTTCIQPFERVRDLERSTTLPIEEDDSPVSCTDGSGSLYLWGCDKDSLQAPKWALVEGGIAIFANGNPHVVALYDGWGPIIAWETLLREKLLKPDSPVARLWKNRKPAPASAPACSSGFAGSRLIKWREIR